jgi:hypothetical protein
VPAGSFRSARVGELWELRGTQEYGAKTGGSMAMMGVDGVMVVDGL